VAVYPVPTAAVGIGDGPEIVSSTPPCVIVTVPPLPIDIVELRGAPVVLAATVKLNDPLPLPVDDPIETQLSGSVGPFQAPEDVTATAPLPPFTPKLNDAGVKLRLS
jgi:hypothetical protein